MHRFQVYDDTTLELSEVEATSPEAAAKKWALKQDTDEDTMTVTLRCTTNDRWYAVTIRFVRTVTAEIKSTRPTSAPLLPTHDGDPPEEL